MHFSPLSQLLIVVSCGIILSNGQKFTICPKSYDDSACQQIARDDTLKCAKSVKHGVDCLIGIDTDRTNVGRISGEEALLAANLVSEDVVVLGEIKISGNVLPETVVIVRSSIPNDFVSLSGKTLCHPGFQHDSSVSPLLLKELEQKIISLREKTYCESTNMTFVEREVSALAGFFGETCRPGPWTQDVNFDKILKEKYPSLCALCGEKKCDGNNYKAPFSDALACLKVKNADIAISTIREAYRFFNNSANAQTYKYLCEDGTSRAASAPCTWSKSIPNLIVSDRANKNQIQTYLTEKLKTNAADVALNKNLKYILRIEKQETIEWFPEAITLQTYINNKGRVIPTAENSTQCSSNIKWCTNSDQEYKKCQWLRQAALNRGIQPVLECVQEENELSCLNDLKKKVSDLVVSSSDHAYITLKKELKSIAYPETDSSKIHRIFVVKHKNSSSINSFSDLKGKQACIPEFGGKEHLAFVDILRDQKVTTEKRCDYGKILNDFVENSCVPGVRSNLISEATQDVSAEKLCNNCVPLGETSTASYCNADSGNKYWGTEGALRCLEDNAADFAVITLTNSRKFSKLNASEFQILCKNNSLASYEGLDIDDECALNIVTTSEVVSREANPKNADIILTLREFEMWFGKAFEKPFHLFDAFNFTKDLLFKDSTPGLDFDTNNKYVRNYDELLQRAQHCSSAISIFFSPIVLTISAILLIINVI